MVKKLLGTLCVLLVMFILDNSVVYGEAFISDEILEAELLAVFDLDNDGYLSDDECSNVREIHISDKNIKNLEGIQRFTMLYDLEITNAGITDIECLRGLPLQKINLAGNYIEDISCICEMSDLQEINFSNNFISDISVFAHISAYGSTIREIDLSYNNISDISSLNSFYYIQKLILNNNQIYSVETIKDICIDRLDLRNNCITELDAFKNSRLYQYIEYRINNNESVMTYQESLEEYYKDYMFAQGNKITGKSAINSLPWVLINYNNGGILCWYETEPFLGENKIYIGDVNTEIIRIVYDSYTNYLSGEIVIVEWSDTDNDGIKESTVPFQTPIISLVSDDGNEEIAMFVTSTGTNTYYFDRRIDGMSEDKKYYVKVKSGATTNLSEYNTVFVYSGKYKTDACIELGITGIQKLFYMSNNLDMLTFFVLPYVYVGNINTEITNLAGSILKNGNFFVGEIIIVEWIDGISTVPTSLPIMTFESVDGTEIIPIFVKQISGNTYYFDRNLYEEFNVNKEYILKVTLTEDNNISESKSMIVNTNGLELKEGVLWQNDEQSIQYRSVMNNGQYELRFFGVNVEK